ncbi:hypothetical protein Tco_1480353 [Tanacetum coccineum]
MAPKITKTVVVPKFDMHTYTSTLTLKELNKVIETFGVPKDLHPRLPSADLTMNRLPGDVIGIYVKQLDQCRISLLYMSGLATDYRHPELSQIQRDSEGKEVTMDNYQMLPDWNGTVVSKEDPIPDDERPPKRTTDPFPPGSVIPDKNSLQNNVEKPEKEIAEACEKKEKQALVKAKTKRIGEASFVALRNKKACKNIMSHPQNQVAAEL